MTGPISVAILLVPSALLLLAGAAWLRNWRPVQGQDHLIWAGGIALAMVLPLHLAFSYRMYCTVGAQAVRRRPTLLSSAGSVGVASFGMLAIVAYQRSSPTHSLLGIHDRAIACFDRDIYRQSVGDQRMIARRASRRAWLRCVLPTREHTDPRT